LHLPSWAKFQKKIHAKHIMSASKMVSHSCFDVILCLQLIFHCSHSLDLRNVIFQFPIHLVALHFAFSAFSSSLGADQT